MRRNRLKAALAPEAQSLFCSAVAWHHLTCLPESSSTSHPILGFREVLRRGKGCTSRGLSSTGQEVHVISLRNGGAANAQVTLTLAPNLLSGAPIFVLHSQQPVQWKLSTSPGKNWTFQVSLGSSISATQLVASAETDFPNTARGLLKWAQRKHGGVTSLAEYRGVNTIYTRLGSGMGHTEAKPASELPALSMGGWDVDPISHKG
ncbi:transforming growth factor beta receptor type 3-like [Ahaetulla prasina]|uniref:transforming growth factor beta receptor type 3-like n=1 Tax=Ahaetulla prasina TaxID=499056 RepID=UPI002648AEDC|nr:transforming growth factor beta receptor type 3-like [Ahaetulla prasina]